MDALFNKLIDVEKKLHLSANRQNINFLREVLHEDFFEFGRSGGTTNKTNTLSVLVDEQPKTIYSEDYHCTLLSDNTLLITYTSFERQQNIKIKLTHRSSIWLKNSKNQWQLRFHQGTPTGGQ
ncbi:TPA: ribonuclease H [Providencia rettgeri]|nr:ribonuclease H [Providencia rettgeri]